MQNNNTKTMALPRYYIPRDLQNVLKDNAAPTKGINNRNRFVDVLRKLKNIDCLEIAKCHYLQFLKLGLYLEEYQQREDTIKQFQLEGTTIERLQDSQEKFKIEVKNLDETNPILNITDSLIAFEPNVKRKTIFFLTVVKVCKGHVIAAADKKFCKMYNESTKYTVELKFNTYVFQCCHYALTAVKLEMFSPYIFPEKCSISSKLNCHQTWFNRGILNNPNQKQAVCNIINKTSFPAPYILYGPPGTGKTSTLVEAICQSWYLSDDYILVCALSNAACDVITKRLLDYIPSNNMYRIYSRTEEYSRIDEEIRKCCNFKDGKVNEIEKVDLSCKKIIITTLCTSLRLEKRKLPFSHLFIDEGGQATLSDILLPFCALKYSQPFQMVISGDHQQLGPGIKSKYAKPLLEQSILEKLMKDKLYEKDANTGYDPRYITKLILSYRSSEEIIHVSNVLFYDNELTTCSNKLNLNFFPVIFWAVTGKEEKSSCSPSPYNDAEVNQVVLHTKLFVGKKLDGKVIKKEDIGIVTLFKLQVAKIKEKLNDAGLKEVDVGTVEIFQGQEREIIIISTVRSKTFVHHGVEHIGFLSNPKRFNVALTRAKSLLVVVGNPGILQTDKYWRYFLRFCQKNESYFSDSLNHKISSSFEDLTVESKTKKSTDLFNSTFTLLKLDDGVLPTRNTNLQDANVCAADVPSTSMSNANSSRNTPVSISSATARLSSSELLPRSALVAENMKKPLNNINSVPNSVVLPGSISSYNRNSPHNSGGLSTATSYNINPTRTNYSEIHYRPDSIKKPLNNINSVPNSVVLPGSINSLNRNSPLNSGGLSTATSYNINTARTNYSEIHYRQSVERENNDGCGCCIIL